MSKTILLSEIKFLTRKKKKKGQGVIFMGEGRLFEFRLEKLTTVQLLMTHRDHSSRIPAVWTLQNSSSLDSPE
jgi:predicted ThiF/HesA family dinucleotide-utilizing enzyme